MSSLLLIAILVLYLAVLFGTAFWAEKKRHSKWVNNPYVYTLSLAVYCTTWTYYGSIGIASDTGVSYLPIYLGPILIAPAWIIIFKKIIRISRVNKISSIADFISLRYGNSRFLGGLISVIALVGILPYLALQLKAVSETFHLVTQTAVNDWVFNDSTTYIAIAIALFSSYYGTRYVDASEKRRGIVTAVALESVLKLFFFVLVGCYVTFFVFDGVPDIYEKAKLLPKFAQLNQINGLSQAINWAFLMLLSMTSIFLLPRQFHVAVVENNKESHINTALWLFPLYLLIFNLFVFPIAWGGNLLFAHKEANADYYSLLIPQLFHNNTLQVLVFLGGFSAAISMVIVSSIGLSTMFTNNLLIPYSFLGALQNEQHAPSNRLILNARRMSIFAIIMLAYVIYRYFGLDYHLVSIGMVSFVILAQLGPSFFGALFWRRGSRQGAIAGLLVGFSICVYTLLIPYALGNEQATSTFLKNGPWDLGWLRPFHLFGMTDLDPIPHAFFWSMFGNVFTFAAFSVSFKGNYRERNYAEMFVDIDQYIQNHENAFVWKGTAYRRDIEKVLQRFLGEERTRRAMVVFNTKYDVDKDQELADARLVKFAENLLTGHIGTASARILIAGVVKEEKISLPEVLNILEESRQHILVNKKLTETSKQLQALTQQLQVANEKLIENDLQKNEFLDTVTHELRTPITAIKASGELLFDDDDIPAALRKQFLHNIITESDRLSRLIDKILDLEKFETGKQVIHGQRANFVDTVQHVLDSLQQLIANKSVAIDWQRPSQLWVEYDEERLIQVLQNLLSNALKFCPETGGCIVIKTFSTATDLHVSVHDNGPGIPTGDELFIFDKFYQSTQQNLRKPVGSGLGLAISRQIIESHGGLIWAETETKGACICFSIPILNIEKD